MFQRSLSAAALLVSISAFLLTGCGGGGSSASVSVAPVVSTTVADSSSSADAAASRAFSPNYAPVIKNDGTWSSRSLAVYVPNANDYAIAEAAMRRWEEATDNYFQFTRVDSVDQAQITFERVSSDSFESGVIGVTKYTFDTGSARLTSAQVRVANTGTESQQVLTTIHEFGHALGIHGHSDGTVDAMYYAVTTKTAITERDLNTLFWMYNNASSTGRAAGTLETRTLNCKH